jgi:transcriptional regulator with GAF, ATPase, and Fis domain
MAMEGSNVPTNAAICITPNGVTPSGVVFHRDHDGPRPVSLEARAGGMVGGSASLQAALARARKVAPTESTVLLTGETGTGKELLARAIHRWSHRADGPFVSVNCAAVPQTLIASELFGHERGAFTGALHQRRGRFELAAGGTLFLDEVGELPVETQVLLLRVLQEREFERVGGSSPVKVDVRVIAATNRDLRRAIADGSFRSDLFYRLAVFPLEMPPLRERGGDLRPLVEHFVRRSAPKLDKTIRSIDPEVFERLEGYSWPGNVRELQNVVERSVIVCESDTFTLDPSWSGPDRALDTLDRGSLATLETDPCDSTSPSERSSSPLDDIQREALGRERAAILDALRACHWVVGGPRGAAAVLGLRRTTLQARMTRFGIPARSAAMLREAQT